ncbi:MAG: hypothetical protein RLZZ546_1699 [Bacteroidota bacterium]|jgi:two-component system LytT family response regulator
MIKAIIIDDETHCIETLAEKIKIYCPSIEIIERFDKPQEALEYLNSHKPDVVFMDIEMPILNGFMLLEKIKQIEFKIIFTTAYDQYAIKAIRFSAFDYLLKPIDKDELILVAERLKSHTGTSPIKDQIEVLMQQLKNTNSHQLKISIPTSEGILFPYVKDIVRIESSSNYSIFYLTNNKKVMVSRTLKEFEDMLSQYDFFRIHNSHLINLKKIVKVLKGEINQVELDSGDLIEISRRRKDEFLKVLKTMDFV